MQYVVEKLTWVFFCCGLSLKEWKTFSHFLSLSYAVFEDAGPLGVAFVGRRMLDSIKKEGGWRPDILSYSTDICHWCVPGTFIGNWICISKLDWQGFCSCGSYVLLKNTENQRRSIYPLVLIVMSPMRKIQHRVGHTVPWRYYLSFGLKGWGGSGFFPRARKRIVHFINGEELNSLEFNISELERHTETMASGLSEFSY